jgi:lysophospholipase L1-like esterase
MLKTKSGSCRPCDGVHVRRTTIFVGAMLVVANAVSCRSFVFPDPDAILVAFGDSATRGPAGRDYPEILADRLNRPPADIANAGRGGETSAEGLIRLCRLIDMRIYPNAATLLFWEGGNDVIDFIGDHDPLLIGDPTADDYPFRDALSAQLDATQSAIASAIAAGRQAGWTVYVATYYPLRESLGDCNALPFNMVFPAQARIANAYVDMLNDRIRIAASATGARLVDIAADGDAFAADMAHYENCNHLSASGNAIVADRFAAAIGE